jgi:hypothetical protein
MCDYSLHAVATRPAEVAETLVSTKFHATTRGFASPNDRRGAVCLRPGTEVAFEKDAQTDRMVFRKRLALDWLGFAKSIRKNLKCIMTLSNSPMARSF